MDRAGARRRNSGGRDLGISCVSYQQFSGAAAGPGDGWGPAVAAVPWQRGVEHSPAVQLGFGALPGGNCFCCAVPMVAEEARGTKGQSGAGGQEGFAAGCRTAFDYSCCSASCRAYAGSGHAAAAPVAPLSAPVQAKPTPPPAAAPAKPEKPKPPKEVYYNIVGEPINPTEDD